MAKTETKYGLNVNGVVRVFRKDKPIKGQNKKTYVATDVWYNVSEKEEDGTYFNRSMNLLFKRDVARPENNTVINIVNAFPVITGNGDYRKIALMVTEWEPAEGK